MSDQYMGEIRMFAGGYAPQGWALCNGQLLPITDNEALFTLIGTTYGGDGMTTFGVPDMRGRVPISVGNGAGSNYMLGQKSGAESVTLLTSQMPAMAISPPPSRHREISRFPPTMYGPRSRYSRNRPPTPLWLQCPPPPLYPQAVTSPTITSCHLWR